MMKYCAALALAWLATSGAAAASELAPGNGHSLRLGGFDGVLYYTVEPDGYHVVATLASADAPAIRFVATLAPGQSVTISVPQDVGEPSLDIEVARIGEAVTVSGPVAAQSVN